ncbi:related to translation elongation factor HBS1 protein [Serendipita indica DSM 11827]|uniref:Related to translation elongation factor HBS1 protein n=1 Tax=Serendipita indica (strain DSM 11827) TaxID=1109443 RepID=G4T7B5_SERID|nr:related to translation elongation factor HBS1 protein [Serendipita indica DSM 11827]
MAITDSGSIGSVLCSPASPVPLASSIVAQVILFDIQTPLINGASVELFHHARNVPATITLLESLDRVTGVVLKAKPRVLTKGMSGKIRITIRAGSISETAGLASFSRLPVETFKTNKDMGRVLLRRDGETIAAGIILSYDT